MSVRVFRHEMSISIGAWVKHMTVHLPKCTFTSSKSFRTWKWLKDRIRVNSLSVWLLELGQQSSHTLGTHSCFSGCQILSGILAISSLSLRPSNYTNTSFPESAAFRGQSMGLLSFCNQARLLLYLVINLSLYIYVYIFYWFCFSGEPWLMHSLNHPLT